MSMTQTDDKTNRSVLQRIQDGLSKYFVTTESYAFEKTNEYLGITNVADDKSNLSYFLYARYSHHSTAQEPRIVVYHQGESTGKKVYINLINPKNATMLEMFALCSYADDTGLYRGEQRVAYAQLQRCARKAAKYGLYQPIRGYKDFCNHKMNWDKMINEVKDIYLEEEAYDKYQECLMLMELFDVIVQV